MNNTQEQDEILQELEAQIEKDSPNITYQDLVEKIRSWLILENDSIIKLLCATYIANKLPGDPVWLMVVAPPGGSKTELIRGLNETDSVYYLSDLTPQTLLSGSKGEKTGLLERLGNFKIVTMKDFTTILEMHRDKRSEILAQLREVYDGYFRKEFGTGDTKTWEGKIGLITGVTPIIDRYTSVTSVLGERFLLFRLAQPDTYLLAQKAINNTSQENQMRKDIQGAFTTFLEGVEIPEETIEIPEEIKNSIIRLSQFVVKARGGVVRDGYSSREIEFAPDPEVPTRLAKQFTQLLKALYVINGKKYTAQDMELLLQVGFSCIPRKRFDMLEIVASNKEHMNTTDIASKTKYPNSTTRKSLQELNILGLLGTYKDTANYNSNMWYLSHEARVYLEEAGYEIHSAANEEIDNSEEVENMFSE